MTGSAASPLDSLAGVFDRNGRSLIPGRPDLDKATIDANAWKTLVGIGVEQVDAAGFVGTPVGRIWLLLPGATLDRVPQQERIAARAVLWCGHGILLLAPDEKTEAAVRDALLAMAHGDENSEL